MKGEQEEFHPYEKPSAAEDDFHSEGLFDRVFIEMRITRQDCAGLSVCHTTKPLEPFPMMEAWRRVIILLSEQFSVGCKALQFLAFCGLCDYSHSILAGGLVVTSSTTRLTWGTSLTMRAEMVRTTS